MAVRYQIRWPDGRHSYPRGIDEMIRLLTARLSPSSMVETTPEGYQIGAVRVLRLRGVR